MMYPFDREISFPVRRVCLSVIALTLFFGGLKAQDQRITFPASRIEVARAIQAIEQQTGKVFSYNSELLDVSSVVAFSEREVSLDEALDQMLSGRNLGYIHRNQYIIIHPDLTPPPAQTSGPATPRNRTSDVYEQTPLNSIDAGPLRRPAGEETAVEPVVRRVLVEQPAAERPDPSTFHSDYHPLNNYFHTEKYLPSLAVKMNLLYAAATLTPNLAVEVGLGGKTSLNVSGSYNPWNRIGTLDNNDKLVHWVIRPEFRYWLCERFDGHFVSASPSYNQFNISGHDIPFVDFKKAYRYEGNAFGFGVNYGYHLPLGKRWGLEFSAGIGVAQMKYDVFECALCSGKLETKKKTYFGPTHASVNLVFMIR